MMIQWVSNRCVEEWMLNIYKPQERIPESRLSSSYMVPLCLLYFSTENRSVRRGGHCSLTDNTSMTMTSFWTVAPNKLKSRPSSFYRLIFLLSYQEQIIAFAAYSFSSWIWNARQLSFTNHRHSITMSFF